MGLREGEVLGLRWQDVNLQEKHLRVNFALQRIDGKLQLVEPMTEKSRRTLSLTEDVVLMLQAHRVRQLEERIGAGNKWKESGLGCMPLLGGAVH